MFLCFHRRISASESRSCSNLIRRHVFAHFRLTHQAVDSTTKISQGCSGSAFQTNQKGFDAGVSRVTRDCHSLTVEHMKNRKFREVPKTAILDRNIRKEYRIGACFKCSTILSNFLIKPLLRRCLTLSIGAQQRMRRFASGISTHQHPG